MEAEIRDALIAFGEIVKTQYMYLSSMHTGLVKIFDSLKATVPGFVDHYNQHSQTEIVYRDYPGAKEQLETLGVLLEKLRKS
jgi:hypothetical protein